MTLPLLDLAAFDLAQLDGAAAAGAFYLAGHDVDLDRALAAARRFFALPADEKNQLAQERSPAFRGWSEMRGEREQVHFGCERTSGRSGGPWRQLEGPNQWPARLGPAWRADILNLIARMGAVGHRLLTAFARLLSLPPPAPDPYLLLKLIRYPATDQLGVAPHCDFSWLTLLVQEGPGLAVLDAIGQWHPAPPRPGLLLVDIGELLEWASHGRWRAAPHRVQNDRRKSRLSLPLFVNPALSGVIAGAGVPRTDTEHVHRVLAPELPPGQLHFGEAEWRRKGLGRWCHAARCCG
jgi:isopenicillin N synthase-like dioxygenase